MPLRKIFRTALVKVVYSFCTKENIGDGLYLSLNIRGFKSTIRLILDQVKTFTPSLHLKMSLFRSKFVVLNMLGSVSVAATVQFSFGQKGERKNAIYPG